MFPDKDTEKEKFLSAKTLQGEMIWLKKLRLKLPQIKPKKLRTLLQQF